MGSGPPRVNAAQPDTASAVRQIAAAAAILLVCA